MNRFASDVGAVDHVLLDRDGVLNADSSAPVGAPHDWRWLPGSREAVVALGRAGVRVSVVTNQSCIGRGTASAEAVAHVHRAVTADLVAAGGTVPTFFVCPHDGPAACECRKPLPGLVLDAVDRSGIPARRTVLVGDDHRDLEAGLAAGLAVALVRTGKGRAVEQERPAGTPVFDDLHAFVRALGVAVDTHAPPPDTLDAVDPERLDPVAATFVEHLDPVERSLRQVAPSLHAAAGAILAAARSGGKVLVVGNGGSSADASHFAAELVGRFGSGRPGVPAIVVGADTSTLTALANDAGFDAAFAREVVAQSKPGDVVVTISTSGSSPNVVEAARVARESGCGVVALTGSGGGALAELAAIHLEVPSREVARIQEVHGLCLHSLATMIDERLG